MRYKFNTGLFVIFVLLISFSISHLANYLSIDKQIAQRLLETTQKNYEWKERRKKLKVQNGTNHLMWFLQISDIHISMLRDKARKTELQEFVTNTLDVIKPPVVIASGDLTDARSENHLGSRQYRKEWEIYKKILDEGNVTRKTLWLDIRGNHDTFNVPGIDSEFNYFKKYSIQGGLHENSYMSQVTVGDDKYSFIAIDACQDPGTKRPFNFIGIMSVNQTNTIINLAEESRKSGANYIVWFGHYPTSTILSPGTGNRGIRGILGHYDEGYVYLSGHLHTLGGLVKHMYALQDTNFFELELGDWKDNRMFRLAAFDHGLFSFIDVKHKDWPVVLITNPKDSMFNIEEKEDPTLQLKSTHIRILVFNPGQIESCSIKIDDKEVGECQLAADNLYVRKWNPDQYNKGTHNIEVTVITSDNRKKTVKQVFSLDGANRGYSIGAKILLKCSITKLFQALFGLALIVCVLPLCMLRIWHELVYAKKAASVDLKSTCLRRFIRKLWVLSSVDRIFYPYIIQTIYILVGPWSVSHVIDGHMGLIFSWGMFVKGHFIPGTLSYLYGYFELMFCNFPLVFIYAQAVWMRYNDLLGLKPIQRTKWELCLEYIPFIAVLFSESVLAVFVWNIYGPISSFLGPLRTWSLVLQCALFYWAKTLPKFILRPAMDVLE